MLRRAARIVGLVSLLAGCDAGPSTASASDAAPADAAPADAAPVACPDYDASYTACGCGCCPGAPPQMRCLDRAHGETFESVEAADHAAASNPGCSMAGCSLPMVIVCCP